MYNCHTHIFTEKHVPRYLAKSFIPKPFYYFVPLHPILRAYKSFTKWRDARIYSPGSFYNRARHWLHQQQKKAWWRYAGDVIKGWLTVNAAFILVFNWVKFKPAWLIWLVETVEWLNKYGVLVSNSPRWIQVVIVVVVVLFFKSGRNLLFFLLKSTVAGLRRLPGENMLNLIKRYILIGKYTMYQNQSTVFYKLRHQYPPGTKFVVLPMDMKYMGAGKIPKAGGFYNQMHGLYKILSSGYGDQLIPFLFVDPRRIDDSNLNAYIAGGKRKADIARLNGRVALIKPKVSLLRTAYKNAQTPGEELIANKKLSKARWQLRDLQAQVTDLEEMKPLFEYEIQTNDNGNIVALDPNCMVHEYLEKTKKKGPNDIRRSGFKIYPALGYYPFDEALLPLWKYAADNEIPIMTHCISGTIFYRGEKELDWYEHPIFKEFDAQKKPRPLKLTQKRNIDFSVNFGHPLNYLCLLEERLLREVVATCKNQKTKDLFGFTSLDKELKHDLSKLKICFAHYGGEPQWEKYLEADRYPFAQRLIRNRKMGINFKLKNATDVHWGLLTRIWHSVDWYSIISSIIVQNENVYADISYILSKPRTRPLLKETLDPILNSELFDKVLYGTDFYVVRNHLSEKDLLVQLKSALTPAEFNQIASINPVKYLK